MLHLPVDGKLGDDVGNRVGDYDHFRLTISGTVQSYSFHDSSGHFSVYPAVNRKGSFLTKSP